VRDSRALGMAHDVEAMEEGDPAGVFMRRLADAAGVDLIPFIRSATVRANYGPPAI
jgi:hypothetical protein